MGKNSRIPPQNNLTTRTPRARQIHQPHHLRRPRRTPTRLIPGNIRQIIHTLHTDRRCSEGCSQTREPWWAGDGTGVAGFVGAAGVDERYGFAGRGGDEAVFGCREGLAGGEGCGEGEGEMPPEGGYREMEAHGCWVAI